MSSLEVYKTDIHTWTYAVARVKGHQAHACADTEGRSRYTSNAFEISEREDGCPPGLFAPWKVTRCPLYRRLDKPQGLGPHYEELKPGPLNNTGYQ